MTKFNEGDKVEFKAGHSRHGEDHVVVSSEVEELHGIEREFVTLQDYPWRVAADWLKKRE